MIDPRMARLGGLLVVATLALNGCALSAKVGARALSANWPCRSSEPSLGHGNAIQITARVLHRGDPIPVLPSVRQRVSSRLDPTFNAESDTQAPLQLWLKLQNERGEVRRRIRLGPDIAFRTVHLPIKVSTHTKVRPTSSNLRYHTDQKGRITALMRT